MKAFSFPLDRVRNYKNQVLDIEKKVLGELIAERDAISVKILKMQEYCSIKNEELADKQLKGVCMGELVSCNYLIDNARKQIEILGVELQKANEAVEVQRDKVVVVYQEKTGMDKLEEKQVEEYRMLIAKANEGEIMQVISNRMADKDTENSIAM